MRNFYFILVAIFLTSCSVDKDEITEETLVNVNAVTVVDECSAVSLQFMNDGNQLGTVGLQNFEQSIQLTFNSQVDPINRIRVHFTDSEGDFPIKGNGEYNTAQFTFSENLDKNIFSAERKFNFSDLNIQTGDLIYISIAVEFGSGKSKKEIFAYDSFLTGSKKYFPYTVELPVYYAGKDGIKEISLTEAIAIPSEDELRKLYFSILDEGIADGGTYSPTMEEIVDDFNKPGGEMIGDYTTTYTIGAGSGCSDSAQLTIRVVPDVQ